MIAYEWRNGDKQLLDVIVDDLIQRGIPKRPCLSFEFHSQEAPTESLIFLATLTEAKIFKASKGKTGGDTGLEVTWRNVEDLIDSEILKNHAPEIIKTAPDFSNIDIRNGSKYDYIEQIIKTVDKFIDVYPDIKKDPRFAKYVRMSPDNFQTRVDYEGLLKEFGNEISSH